MKKINQQLFLLFNTSFYRALKILQLFKDAAKMFK